MAPQKKPKKWQFARFFPRSAIILTAGTKPFETFRTWFSHLGPIMDVLAAMCEMTSKQQRDGDGETSEETEMYVVLNS